MYSGELFFVVALSFEIDTPLFLEEKNQFLKEQCDKKISSSTLAISSTYLRIYFNT